MHDDDTLSSYWRCSRVLAYCKWVIIGGAYEYWPILYELYWRCLRVLAYYKMKQHMNVMHEMEGMCMKCIPELHEMIIWCDKRMVKKYIIAMNTWNGIMHNERYVCKACIDGTRMKYEQKYVDDMYAWNNIWLWM